MNGFTILNIMPLEKDSEDLDNFKRSARAALDHHAAIEGKR